MHYILLRGLEIASRNLKILLRPKDTEIKTSDLMNAYHFW